MSTTKVLLILNYLWMHAIKHSLSTASYKASIGSNPNIIFVLTDDWGINDVSWTQPDWDNTDTQTPYLNNLAVNEGVILSNYYAERVCTATRASFLTGRYPSRYGLQAGVLHQNQPFGLTRQVSLLSNEFQTAGYSTHIIGKWHLGYQAMEYTPTYRGFDSFYGFWNGGSDYYTHKSSIHYDGDPSIPMLANDLYIDDQPAMYNPYDGIYGVWWQRDEALKILKTKAAEQINDNGITTSSAKPFFFYFALQASHNPREAPDEYNDLYVLGPDTGNHDRITMKAQGTTVDDAMKDIIDYVKESGLWENTLIVFGSDNGGKKTIGDNAPYRGYKNTSWEGGVKVAGFVTGGVLNDDVKGTINSYSMHMVDWYPTLMSAAGLDINYERSTKLDSSVDDLRDIKWLTKEEMELDGVDMWPYIQNGETDDDYFQNEREILLDLNDVWCQHESCGALKIGRYKYIRGNNIATLMPDYDGADWDRAFVLDADAAESWCLSHKEAFAKKHGVTFGDKDDDDLSANEDSDPIYQDPDTTAVSVPDNNMINSLGCQGTDMGCLFDLELDPCEYYDLSEVYPEILAKFQNRLNEFQQEATVTLMGENNINELAPKQMINPRTVCSNPNYWCSYQKYDDVMWEYKLYDESMPSSNYNGWKEEGTPMLNTFLYMCLWIGMCVGLFFVCKHEHGKKYGHFMDQNNRYSLHELQPLVAH